VNQELKDIKQSKKMKCNVYLHLISKCTTRMQKLNAHSSEDEEKRRPFLSTLTSSLMLQEIKRFEE